MNQVKPNDRDKKIKGLVRDFLLPRIDQTTQDLMRMGWWDLWYGPFANAEFEEENGGPLDTPWPGFVSAVEAINRGLEGLPRTLYVDLDCDGVAEAEPQGEWVDDPEDPDANEDGQVWREPYTDEVYTTDWSEIKEALCTELGEYLA